MLEVKRLPSFSTARRVLMGLSVSELSLALCRWPSPAIGHKAWALGHWKKAAPGQRRTTGRRQKQSNQRQWTSRVISSNVLSLIRGFAIRALAKSSFPMLQTIRRVTNKPLKIRELLEWNAPALKGTSLLLLFNCHFDERGNLNIL